MDQSCISVTRQILPRKRSEEIAAIFAALSEPNRLAILYLLVESEEEVCVCDITASFSIGQSTISRHLKELKEAGLVTGQKRGKWVYYSPVRPKIEEVRDILDGLLKTLVLSH